MKLAKLYPFLCFILFTHTALGENKKGGPSDELVKIAILDFSNESGRNELNYLGKSLALNIQSELKKQFLYSEKSVNSKSEPLTAREKNRLLKQSGVDVLIYGDFSESQVENTIQIQPYILFQKNSGEIKLPQVSNKIDSTLLYAINTVTKSIVMEIDKIAVGAHESNKANQKIILKKESIEVKRSSHFVRNNVVKSAYQLGAFSMFYDKLDWDAIDDFSIAAPLPADFPYSHAWVFSYTRLNLFDTAFLGTISRKETFQQRVYFDDQYKRDVTFERSAMYSFYLGYRKPIDLILRNRKPFLNNTFGEVGLGYGTVFKENYYSMHDVTPYLMEGIHVNGARIFKYEGFSIPLYMKLGKAFSQSFSLELTFTEEFYFYDVTSYETDFATQVGETVTTFSDRFLISFESGYHF